MQSQLSTLNPASLRDLKWRLDTPLLENLLPPKIAPWLCDRGSLTSALMGLADGSFEVELLSQRLTTPFWHEQKKLKRSFSIVAMIREVNLRVHGEPVVFARSIIPLSLAGRGGGGLATLGQTPLGHLLFKDGRIRVSRRDFATMTLDGKPVYARRTPYDYLGDSILVSEYFLPSLNKYL